MAPLLGVAAVALIAWLNSGGERQPAPDRVVLLPAPDGKVGKVLVSSSAGEQLLATAYAEAEVDAAGRIVSRSSDADSVRSRYGAALDARPPRPLSLRVHFVSGGDQLTPESQPVIAELKDELARRPAPEVTVIGHTDRVGKVEDNDSLSLKRAAAVRALLIEQGVPAAAIEVAGRGEREPLLPTADEVAEAQNRRVEIGIR